MLDISEWMCTRRRSVWHWPRADAEVGATRRGVRAAVSGTSWKAQVRLCARYRRLAAVGKPKVAVTTAIAREVVGFIWAIARSSQPAHQSLFNRRLSALVSCRAHAMKANMRAGCRKGGRLGGGAASRAAPLD
jgi:hypothetical protein